MRLKLLADVGLVGLPNAGKSSLLGRLTRAAPKVGDYPFTTLSPVLGTIEGEDRQAVVADIPGLIEGAAEGAGLGHEFLAHVERCSVLVHLVDLAPLEGDPASSYEAVRGELAAYGAGLERLPELVALSKRDLLPGDEVERALAEWRARLGDRAARRARRLLRHRRGPRRAAPGDPRRPPEPRRRPGPSAATSARPSSRPSTASTGRSARAATRSSARPTAASASSAAASSCSSSATTSPTRRRSPTSSSASTRSASSRRCAKAGFEPGDDVRVGEHEFELHP